VVFTLQQIDLLRRLATQYPKVFSSPDVDSERAIATFREGKIISPLAIEGLHSIGTSISLLRLYRALGVKYATLTHNCHNPFADAALVTNETGSTVNPHLIGGG
jgi:membrane dipeptidase